jgi:hypothetical protein
MPDAPPKKIQQPRLGQVRPQLQQRRTGCHLQLAGSISSCSAVKPERTRAATSTRSPSSWVATKRSTCTHTSLTRRSPAPPTAAAANRFRGDVAGEGVGGDDGRVAVDTVFEDLLERRPEGAVPHIAAVVHRQRERRAAGGVAVGSRDARPRDVLEGARVAVLADALDSLDAHVERDDGAAAAREVVRVEDAPQLHGVHPLRRGAHEHSPAPDEVRGKCAPLLGCGEGLGLEGSSAGQGGGAWLIIKLCCLANESLLAPEEGGLEDRVGGCYLPSVP